MKLCPGSREKKVLQKTEPDPVVEKAVRLNRQKRTAACEGGQRLSVVADQTVFLFGLDLTSAGLDVDGYLLSQFNSPNWWLVNWS